VKEKNRKGKDKKKFIVRRNRGDVDKQSQPHRGPVNRWKKRKSEDILGKIMREFPMEEVQPVAVQTSRMRSQEIYENASIPLYPERGREKPSSGEGK